MKIHMTGICGVAMGSLAGMLKEIGHEVTGSDENIYPPMSDILHDLDIAVKTGFSADNPDSPDLVIIGNAVSRGNPEVEYVLDEGIPYMSMASALYEFFLKEKEVIAVCGTHGKSTTAALIAHILETAGEDPSFFVGGNLKNYSSNYKLGKGRFFVVEGDEYDSAFFEKVPKFFFYKPNHLVLTSLEFDHADIYSGIDEIRIWFKRLVNTVPSNGKIVYSGRYPLLEEVVSDSFSENIRFSAVTDGFSFEFTGYFADYSELLISGPNKESYRFRTALLGDFNYDNITAAVSILMKLGIPVEKIQAGVESFSGVLRRQDVIYRDDKLVVFEDFAHHPTAIRYMIDTLRHRFPDSVISAVYEPRSATSRRNVFQSSLPESFLNADHVFLKTPGNMAKIPECDRLDAGELCSGILNKGVDAKLFSGVEEIIDSFVSGLSSESHQVAVIMSNGGFDDIYKKMVYALNPQ